LRRHFVGANRVGVRGLYFFVAFSLAAGCGRANEGAMMALVGDGGEADSGGDDASTACQSASACGGDPVGTWSITTSCLAVDISGFTDGCEGATARAMDYAVTGTIIYNADLTYVVTGTLTGRVVATWPAPCLTPANGTQVTCEQLRAGLLAPGTYQSVTCVAASSGCTCSVVMNPLETRSAGRYVTDGAGMLTETDSAGSERQRSYCVQGAATMTLSPYPGAAATGQIPMASGLIGLMKL
jgi:hypothetical protein